MQLSCITTQRWNIDKSVRQEGYRTYNQSTAATEEKMILLTINSLLRMTLLVDASLITLELWDTHACIMKLTF